MTIPPDFIIIGAPKAGTTSLASWLGAHPSLFMADPKEPAHFSQDIKEAGAVRDPVAYERLFSTAKPEQLTGEASTAYLRSRVAVPKVLGRRSDTRLIVCLRNPIEMMPSVHSQLLQGGRETLADPEKAWAAQEARRKGRDLPSFCPEPSVLDYAAVCSLGAQVKRLLDVARRDQIHFVFNEDMRIDPGGVYRSALAFLDVADDGRSDFSALNQRISVRSTALSQYLARTSALRRRVWRGGSTLGLGALVARLNTKSSASNITINSAFRTHLITHFADDINALATLTDRDLSEWLT